MGRQLEEEAEVPGGEVGVPGCTQRSESPHLDGAGKRLKQISSPSQIPRTY